MLVSWKGWWLLSDGRERSLADEGGWKQALHAAAFQLVNSTGIGTKNSDILQVITASPYHGGSSQTAINTKNSKEGDAHRPILTYKKVDGLEI